MVRNTILAGAGVCGVAALRRRRRQEEADGPPDLAAAMEAMMKAAKPASGT